MFSYVLSAMDGNSSFEIVAAFVSDSYIDQGILLTYLSGIVFRIYDILCIYVNVYVYIYIYICTYVYLHTMSNYTQDSSVPKHQTGQKSQSHHHVQVSLYRLSTATLWGRPCSLVLLVLFNPWIPSGKLA